MSASPSITARLLAASRAAYGAGVETNTLQHTIDGVGCVVKCVAFVAGPDATNAALLFSCSDCVILAMRGTLPPDSPDRWQVVLDWLTDFQAALVADASFPGRVHEGFLRAINSLWPTLVPAVVDAVKPGLPLYITGHSKGGGLSILAAWLLRQLSPRVATFAAPRCGDDEFVKAYDAAVPHCARHEWADDLVPHLPPAPALASFLARLPRLAGVDLVLGYGGVAELRFADWSGRIVQEAPVLEAERTWRLLRLVAAGDFDAIIQAHSIAPGSGYATAFAGVVDS